MKAYLEEVKRLRIKYRYVVIYGAGRKGLALYDLLKQNEVKVDGFLVTNSAENKKEERGFPIFGISEKPFPPEETLILIGVRNQWNGEVVEILKKYQYKNYIEAIQGIEYLSEKEMERSHRPVLEVTPQIGCRINCRYCPQDLFVKRYTDDSRREHSMTLEQFKYYVDQTEPEVIWEFAGFSEPFFHPACMEMLEYVYQTGHEIELYTTLGGVKESDLERLIELPFRDVILHIPDRDRNSNIVIDDSYLKILQKIVDAKSVSGAPFVERASCHGEVAEEVKEIIAGKLRIITSLHDRAGNLENKNLEHGGKLIGAIKCTNTVAQYPNHNVLLPDGTIVLCASDWGMCHILGNLKKQRYQEILQGKEIREINRLMNSENGEVICRNCWWAVNK